MRYSYLEESVDSQNWEEMFLYTTSQRMAMDDMTEQDIAYGQFIAELRSESADYDHQTMMAESWADKNLRNGYPHE